MASLNQRAACDSVYEYSFFWLLLLATQAIFIRKEVAETPFPTQIQCLPVSDTKTLGQ